MSKDERAYELLKFQSLAPLGEFDPSFPYFDVWKASSDAALKAWDKEHPYHGPSDELAAFLELQHLRLIPKNEYYSPTKAHPPEQYLEDNDKGSAWPTDYYVNRLKQATEDGAGVEGPQAGAGKEADTASPARGTPDSNSKVTRLHGRHARHGSRARNRRRGQGPRPA
jgi:hypothetical protein